jgi:hypothetical protein
MNKQESKAIQSSKARGITTSDGQSSITTVCTGPAFIETTINPFSLIGMMAFPTPKQEKQMTHIASNDPHYTQRNHLIQRLYEADQEHEHAINVHTHLYETDMSDMTPEAAMELMADKTKWRWKSTERAKQPGFNPYNIRQYIEFREHDFDKKAHDAAQEKRRKARDTVMDSIVIDEPSKAKMAVNTFRDTTFH